MRLLLSLACLAVLAVSAIEARKYVCLSEHDIISASAKSLGVLVSLSRDCELLKIISSLNAAAN